MEQVFQTEMTFILAMEHEPGRRRWSCALLQLCPEALAQKPLLCDVWGEMESKGHSSGEEVDLHLHYGKMIYHKSCKGV